MLAIEIMCFTESINGENWLYCFTHSTIELHIFLFHNYKFVVNINS